MERSPPQTVFTSFVERNWKTAVMVLSAIFSLGMAYAKLLDDISEKAPQSAVTALESDIRDIKGILCAATPNDYRCR